MEIVRATVVRTCETVLGYPMHDPNQNNSVTWTGQHNTLSAVIVSNSSVMQKCAPLQPGPCLWVWFAPKIIEKLDIFTASRFNYHSFNLVFRRLRALQLRYNKKKLYHVSKCYQWSADLNIIRSMQKKVIKKLRKYFSTGHQSLKNYRSSKFPMKSSAPEIQASKIICSTCW